VDHLGHRGGRDLEWRQPRLGERAGAHRVHRLDRRQSQQTLRREHRSDLAIEIAVDTALTSSGEHAYQRRAKHGARRGAQQPVFHARDLSIAIRATVDSAVVSRDHPGMLSIDLTGKHALVAGVADDGGFGFAIAKALAEAGAKVSVATW